MEGTLGIGIIGLMGYGRSYFSELARLSGVRVAAVCDLQPEVLEEVANQQGIAARYTSYRDLLARSDVDAVFIATPHFLHHQMTMDALRAGKHVFCEKPLAMNAEEAGEMAALARAKGLKLSCHYNRRQSPAVKLLREAVRQDLLGEVYALNVKWMARYTRFMFAEASSWRVSKDKAGGGILIGRGSHMIDAALYILGMPRIQSLSAHVANRLTGFEVDDYAQLMLRLEGGAVIQVEVSYEANLPQYRELIEYQALGSRGGAHSAQMDGGAQRFSIGRCRFPQDEWEDLSGQLDQEAVAQGYPVSIVSDFINAVRTGGEPLITGEDGAYITHILDAAYRSSQLGREVILS